MITICMNDCQINGESIQVIEVWTTWNRATNEASICAIIPIERGETVRVTGDVLKIGSTEEGQPTVLLQ